MALVNRAANASLEAKVPFVVVLVDGKPTAEPGLKDLPVSQLAQVLSYFAPAPLLTTTLLHAYAQGGLLAAFQGGQAAGLGVASVISGEYNPSGKL